MDVAGDRRVGPLGAAELERALAAEDPGRCSTAHAEVAASPLKRTSHVIEEKMSTPWYRKSQVISFAVLAYMDILTDLWVGIEFIAGGEHVDWGCIIVVLSLWFYMGLGVHSFFSYALTKDKESCRTGLAACTLTLPYFSAHAAWDKGRDGGWEKNVTSTHDQDGEHYVPVDKMKIGEAVAESVPQSFFQFYTLLLQKLSSTSDMQRLSIVSSIASTTNALFHWRKNHCMGQFDPAYSKAALGLQCFAENAFRILALAIFACSYKFYVIVLFVLVWGLKVVASFFTLGQFAATSACMNALIDMFIDTHWYPSDPQSLYIQVLPQWTLLDISMDIVLVVLPFVGLQTSANDPLNPRLVNTTAATGDETDGDAFFRSGLCHKGLGSAWDCADQTKFPPCFLWACIALFITRWGALWWLKSSGVSTANKQVTGTD
jgi:hypothetical protein